MLLLKFAFGPGKLPGLSRNAPLERSPGDREATTGNTSAFAGYLILPPNERIQNGGKDTGDETENGHAQITQLKEQNKTRTDIRTGLSKELTAILPIIYR